MILLIPILAIFGGWALFMVVWGLTGRRAEAGRSVGGAPFWQYVSLAEDEYVVGALRAIWQASPRVAHQGMLYFTNRRVLCVPRRYPRAPKVCEYRIGDIVDWDIEERRRLGLGPIVPLARPALVVKTADYHEHVHWGAPGYDIVSKAAEALPAEMKRGSGR